MYRGDEVADRAVRHHHALGFAGGTRRVDDVGRLFRVGGFPLDPGPGRSVRGLQSNDFGTMLSECVFKRCGGQQDRHLRVFDHEAQPVLGIAGVQRHIRTTSLQDAEEGSHHVGGAFGTQAYQ